MTVPVPVPPRSATESLRLHVGSVVTQLQRFYLADQQSLSGPAAAQLARLRREVAASPGADPFIWQLLFEKWPSELAVRGDDVTSAETSAHTALCLYAIHQQSERTHPMHVVGRTLGGAVARLARPAGEEEQRVRRRFNALATAATLGEIVHHSKGLITQLRSADIPLDYGRFAADLFLLQSPAHADAVRRQWGRDYYRDQPPATGPAGDATPTTRTAAAQTEGATA